MHLHLLFSLCPSLDTVALLKDNHPFLQPFTVSTLPTVLVDRVPSAITIVMAPDFSWHNANPSVPRAISWEWSILGFLPNDLLPLMGTHSESTQSRKISRFPEWILDLHPISWPWFSSSLSVSAVAVEIAWKLKDYRIQRQSFHSCIRCPVFEVISGR